MHIMFTEQELSAIDMKPFGWKASSDAPKKIRESIKRKLSMIESQRFDLERNSYLDGQNHG